MKLLLTNARSLSPKIESLHDYFEEHELDVALITESWLRDSRVLDRDVVDLEHGTDLKIIYRNRAPKRASLRPVGGGVSIVFNKNTCSLRERKIRGNKFELVAAVGRVARVPRKVAFFCLYIEPRMKADDLDSLKALLTDELIRLKAAGDHLLFVGGDLNRRDISDVFLDFPDMRRANHDPTRHGVCLDILYTNYQHAHSSVWPPLHTNNGTRSDHDCVVFLARQDRLKDFVWIKKKVRVITSRACRQFGSELERVDWETLMPSDADPDTLVAALEAVTNDLMCRLFPERTVKQRSNEYPWITNAIRNMARKKRFIYKREGKSNYWKSLRDRQDAMIGTSKNNFVNKVSSGPGGTSSAAYFRAVKSLCTKGNPEPWTVTDLFPDKSVEQAGEEVADYFTRISSLFRPLEPEPTPAPQLAKRGPVSVDEVATRIRNAKKPNSHVEGDLLPRLLKEHHHLLAEPATKIYNAIFRTVSWPSRWKVETTVVIPKTTSPSSLAETRNISCTNFLSKVLESILLDDLRAEIPLDPAQYGGVPGCSVNHLLIDIFEAVLSGVDSGKAAVMLGIDYEKAFNRLDHSECLRQLQRLGASAATVALVRSFLTGRKMRVRLGGTMSSLRDLCGGSPQGSILGCILYCLTTQQINGDLVARLRDLPPTVASPVRPGHPTESSTPTSPVWGWAAPDVPRPDLSRSADSFMTAEDSLGSPQSDPRNLTDDEIEKLLLMFKYVDDTTLVEIVDKEAGIRHYSSTHPTEAIPADLITGTFRNIIRRAGEIGMLVNCSKTQAICISPDNGCSSSTTVSAGGETIRSGSKLKLLGFVFDEAGSVGAQIDYIKERFRARFWSLIHLKRAGIQGQRLLKLYNVFVRSIIETNSVVYHPMMNKSQTAAIERMQKLAVKLCFGFDRHYEEICVTEGIKTLEERRTEAITKFTRKCIDNPRFANKWFIERQAVGTNIRNRRPFIELKARTTKYFNSPLLHIQRTANDIMTTNQ